VITVPILAHARVAGRPRGTRAPAALPHVLLDEALTRTWPTSARTMMYGLPSHPHRLLQDEIATYANDHGGVPMQLIVLDVDDDVAHRDGLCRARPDWIAAERVKLSRLLADRPGGYVYFTPRGYRALWRLAEPFVLRSERDARTWAASYLAIGDELRERYGIALDPSGSRWTQPYILPRATREGRSTPERPDTIGDPQAIGAWELRIVEAPASVARGTAIGDAADSVIGRACIERGLARKVLRGGRMLATECPFGAEHSSSSSPTSTVVMAATTERRMGWLHCSHAHCADRTQADFRRALGIDQDSYALARLRRDLDADDDARTVPLDGVAEQIGSVLDAIAMPGRLLVVRVPTGAGKSRAAMLAIARSRRPVVLAVPTHALADEHEARMQALGVTVARRRGLLAVVLADGTPACSVYARAVALQDAGGSVATMLCPTCPHRQGCPARKREARRRVVLTVHQLASASLDAAAGDTLLVYDETPALTETLSLTRADLDAARTMLTSGILDARFARSVGAWVVALSSAASDDEHDLATACARADAHASRPARTLMSWAREHAAGADAIRTGARWLGTEPALADGDLHAVDGERWAEAMHAIRVYRAILAAQTTSRIAWRNGALAVHVDTSEATLIRERGAVVLDATPPTAMLDSLAADGVWSLSLTVPDGAAITRTILYTIAATRSKLAPRRTVDWTGVRALLARALDAVRVLDGRTLVIAYKSIADGLRAGKLADLLGERTDVAHFGAVRGLDVYREHAACITLGDPIPEIGEEHERASVLGLDGDSHIRAIARAELAQAHGRLRDPSRSTPATHVHVGMVAPLGWTSAMTSVVVRAPGGRRNERTVSTATLRAFVERSGGQRAAARKLGIHLRSLQRYLAGRALPRDLAGKISSTGSGVRSRAPRGDAGSRIKGSLRDPASPHHRGEAAR
jgi:hypothetical protein